MYEYMYLRMDGSIYLSIYLSMLIHNVYIFLKIMISSLFYKS